jgi:hypothetical protein
MGSGVSKINSQVPTSISPEFVILQVLVSIAQVHDSTEPVCVSIDQEPVVISSSGSSTCTTSFCTSIVFSL